MAVDNISFPNFRLDVCLAALFIHNVDINRFNSDSASVDYNMPIK